MFIQFTNLYFIKVNSFTKSIVIFSLFFIILNILNFIINYKFYFCLMIYYLKVEPFLFIFIPFSDLHIIGIQTEFLN